MPPFLEFDGGSLPPMAAGHLRTPHQLKEYHILACRISVPRRLSFFRPILLHRGLFHNRQLPPGFLRVEVIRKHARRKKDFGYRAPGNGQFGGEAGTGL